MLLPMRDGLAEPCRQFEEQGDCFIGYQVHYHKNGPRPRVRQLVACQQL